MIVLYFAAQIFLISSSCSSKPYHAPLSAEDGSTFFWTVDYKTEEIFFEIHTDLGPSEWYAFGFSDYGDPYPSDLCFLWVDYRRKTHFQDTWIMEDGKITVDMDQNCLDFRSKRSKGKIKFFFSRKFDTCDHSDYIIEDGTTHIVWAKGNATSYEIDGLNLTQIWKAHGFQRVQLLKPNVEEVKPPDTWELTIRGTSNQISSAETTYWCEIFKLPGVLTKKHHIIQYGPHIDEKNEHRVHHMEVFHCEAEASVPIPHYRGLCDGSDRPDRTRVCKRVLAAWAMGATDFIYPKEAGLPIGGPNYNLYVMLEIHFHNPELASGLQDTSGIKFVLTPTLRQYDGGVMELGLEYIDKMAIPPGQSAFPLHGFCVKKCTAQGLPENGIMVFGSQLHTHDTGVKVFTKHIRDGVELPELNRDNHYSPHYQEIRRLKGQVHVRPGDALITTCIYKTTSRENITLGGFSTTDEMCVNYIHYYPRTDLEVCKSSITDSDLQNYFKYMSVMENQDTWGSKGISAKYRAIDWNPQRVHQLEQLLSTSGLSMQCNKSSGVRFPGTWEHLQPTKVQLHYLPPQRPCRDQQ